MNDWSPGTLTTHYDDDFGHLQAVPAADEYAGYGGMSNLLPEYLSSMQDPSIPAGFFTNVVQLERGEPDVKSETGSSHTPDSGTMHHSDVSVAAPSARVGQKKRRSTSGSLMSTSSTKLSTQTNREKNRIAASKCRKKKKGEEHQLEERRRLLQIQHNILQTSASQLQDEVLYLKHEILRHGECDFPPIRSYIEHAAGQLC